MFRVEYAKGIVKDLLGLPPAIRRKAIQVIEQQLASTPTAGIPLSGPYRGLRKYRVGDWRIIYKIEASRLVIFVLRIRHRKDVYRGIL